MISRVVQKWPDASSRDSGRLVFFNGFGSSRISRAVAAEKLGRRRARARARRHLGCYSNKNNLQIDANESLLHLENVIRRHR